MNELLNLLNEIANEFECDVTFGDEFAYYYAQSLIVVNPNENNPEFLTLARENGLNENVPFFAIAFLHELGHNETIDEIEEDTPNKNDFSMRDYFYCEEEYIATMWVIDFCNRNSALVERIANLL